jgi:hypothetical protein
LLEFTGQYEYFNKKKILVKVGVPIMKRKFALLLVLFILACLLSPSFGQLDLKEKAQLVGVQVDEKPGVTEKEKLTDVAFIFTGKPSQYFHSFKDSVLIIDFYDAEPGEEKLPDITQAPFTGCTIGKDKVDVNKDIEGLEPLFKDIVRVTLPIQKEVTIDYTLSDDFNVITLATVWSKGGAIKSGVTTKKSRKWMYIAGGIVGVTAGTIAYILVNGGGSSGTDTSQTKEWNPRPPPLPTIP